MVDYLTFHQSETFRIFLLLYQFFLFFSSVFSDGCTQPQAPRCRLDCSAATYDFICVDDGGPWSVLRQDFDTLGAGGTDVSVYFWNLNATSVQVEANIFGQLQDNLIRISVMNVPGLTIFPMLRNASKLISLTIVAAPNLLDFSPELLPPVIQHVILFETGITRLENDFTETPELFGVKEFVFQKSNLSYISANFFTVFTTIKTIEISENVLSLSDVADGVFATVIPLERFTMKGNNCSAMSQTDRKLFLQKTLQSLNVSSGTVVDLSNNGLEVEQDSLDSIKLLKDVKELYMQGNPFKNSMSITGLFADFRNLRVLDLSSTTLPISSGTFTNLFALDTLRLAGNYFGDMTAVDMFKGSQSTMLRVLDLSYNSLTGLPDGDLEYAATFVEELILAGNNLLPVEFPQYATLSNETSTKSTFINYRELRYLDLSWNNWTQFDGRLIQPLVNLETIDISCNWFGKITKSFFAGMPTSLNLVNLTFCRPPTEDPPKIDIDAFSTMPPVETLVLAKGSLRNWIFDRLKQMPPDSLARLEHVLLQENNIRFLDGDKLQNFPNWKTLNLRNNTLQSLGDKTFQNLTSLKTLILSYNQLISIDTNDLVGLVSLEKLDLHGNKISHLDKGSFDVLPSLKALYLGRNNISIIQGLFQKDKSPLVHLGLQNNPVGCIAREELDPLDNLKWLYMGVVTTPMYVDSGGKGDLRTKIHNTPMEPGDDLDCDPQFNAPLLQPARTYSDEDFWQIDFIRLTVDNPWDLIARTFTAHVAKCYTQLDRNLTNITGNFFCSMGDGKNAGSRSGSFSFAVVMFVVVFVRSLIKN